MTEFEALIGALADNRVDFVIVGGLAATAHGTARLTQDVGFGGTRLGDLDLLGEIAGGGNYEALLPHTETLDFFGRPCRCVDLPTLIRVKRAAGRPKDLEAIAELEVLLEERLRTGRDQGKTPSSM